MNISRQIYFGAKGVWGEWVEGAGGCVISVYKKPLIAPSFKFNYFNCFSLKFYKNFTFFRRDKETATKWTYSSLSWNKTTLPPPKKKT